MMMLCFDNNTNHGLIQRHRRMNTTTLRSLMALAVAISLLLLLEVRDGGVVQAFAPVTTRSTITASTAKRSSTTTRLHVFERMSEGCIAAVVSAQQQAAKLQLPDVGNEVMMAGCIDEPETRALERTLKQYSITWRHVQRTVTEMYEDDDERSANSNKDKGWLGIGPFPVN
jgi:hypothetical protein